MIITVLLYFFDLFVVAMDILILARVLSSWFGQDSEFYRVTAELTEPVLALVRKVLPQTPMIDLAPMATLILLNLLQTLVHSLIF
jgi:YggT family protein